MARTQLSTVARCLRDGIAWLHRAADRITDARDAAITVSALIAAERNRHSPAIQRLIELLRASQSSNGSWNEEIWDTSWALKALIDVGIPSSDPLVKNALTFIHGTRENIRGTWYGEPFETIVVLDVLSQVSPKLAHEWGSQAIDWLLELQGVSGALIGPHYTAMFSSLMIRLASGSNKRLLKAATRASQWLRRDLRDKVAWTTAAWSNSYALAALLDAGDSFSSPDVAKVIRWFTTHQSSDGTWVQVARLDDTAMSVLVMSRLLTTPLVYIGAPKVGIVRVNRENGTVHFEFETTTDNPIVQTERFKIADEVRVELSASQTFLVALGERLRGRVVPSMMRPLPDDVAGKLVQIGLYAHGHLVPPRVRDTFGDANVDHLRFDIDERLIDLPWELMHDGSDFACLRYAIGRRLISEHRPAETKARISGRRLKVLIVADPCSDLPSAAEEGDSLRALLVRNRDISVDLFKGASITKQDFLLGINEYDIVHFAGHALHDERNPDESFLQFADGEAKAFELARFVRQTPPALVFLNACWSASESFHVDHYPAMIRGLGRTLLYAGVAGFVGYLIPVRDQSAIRLATFFYQSLLAGQTVGESLRLARLLSVQEAADPQDLAWASAVLYGDPTARIVAGSC